MSPHCRESVDYMHDASQGPLVTWCQKVYQTFCEKEAKALANTLKKHDHTHFVLGFDECSFLNCDNPVSNKKATKMSLISMQRVIRAADRFPVDGFAFWYTFIDTNPTIFKLAPTREIPSSYRLSNYLDPLMPYTLTGFDQLAPCDDSVAPLDGFILERVQRFGRPLWSTEPVDTVNMLACRKLFGSDEFNPKDTVHVLAAFSQRVGLDLAMTNESNRIAVESVRSHMRMLVSVVDREFVETMVPSEPMLALAAAQALQPSARDLRDVVHTLFHNLVLQSHVVDSGNLGELYARLLLTLARDAATEACMTCVVKNFTVLGKTAFISSS